MVGRLYLCAPAVDAGVLRAALSGGVDVVQLRDHALDDGGLLRAAGVFRAAAEEAGALFVLNDRPDLAVRCGAGGVHVGQEDATPAEARAAVGPGAVIGRSTRAPEQAAAAAADRGVGYLSGGPVWPPSDQPGRG
ncbi:MAG: thiamine phosphate synthase, partial [Solirubrobacteraceae bacterium]